MALQFPAFYDTANAHVRKRSAVDAGWVQLTPHGKEARLDDPNYPLTSRMHALIEHDNEIDTAAVNPIIRTILFHNNDDTQEKIRYVRGQVIWLVQSRTGCNMHHGYRGLVYWTPVTEANAKDAYPFVMAEPGAIARGGCATVAVCTADATVLHTTPDMTVGRFEPNHTLAAGQQQWGRRTKGLQGELVVVEKKLKTTTLRPLMVTLLQAHEHNKEISVCIHPPVDRPIYGLYKHTR
jgi:hypothetical protein